MTLGIADAKGVGAPEQTTRLGDVVVLATMMVARDSGLGRLSSFER